MSISARQIRPWREGPGGHIGKDREQDSSGETKLCTLAKFSRNRSKRKSLRSKAGHSIAPRAAFLINIQSAHNSDLNDQYVNTNYKFNT